MVAERDGPPFAQAPLGPLLLKPEFGGSEVGTAGGGAGEGDGADDLDDVGLAIS